MTAPGPPPAPLADPEHGVPVVAPRGWLLDAWQVQQTPPLWQPCLAFRFAPEHLRVLLAALGRDSTDRAVFSGPVEVEARHLHVAASDPALMAPPLRCFLPHPDTGDLAAAFDLPAPAALTAALANHDDDCWHLPILLLDTEPGSGLDGTPLTPWTTPLVVYLDRTPVAAALAHSPAYSPALLAPEPPREGGVDPLVSALGGVAPMAIADLWSMLAGIASGHPVAVRRLVMLAALLDQDLGMTLPDLATLAADGPIGLTEMLRHNETDPIQTTAVSVLSAASWLHLVSMHEASTLDAPDPVRGGLAAVRQRALAGEPGAQTAASGLLEHVDAELWERLTETGAGLDGKSQVPGQHPLGRVLTTVLAQVTMRAEVLAPDEPVSFLVFQVDQFLHEVNPQTPSYWPLVTLVRSLAAHDTVVLRALLGDTPEPPGYLLALLFSVHQALTDPPTPGLEAAVRDALEDYAAHTDPSAALTLLDVLAAPDAAPGDVLSRWAYPAAADALCTLLPALADGAAAVQAPDVGGADWVRAQEETLYALLSCPL